MAPYPHVVAHRPLLSTDSSFFRLPNHLKSETTAILGILAYMSGAEALLFTTSMTTSGALGPIALGSPTGGSREITSCTGVPDRMHEHPGSGKGVATPATCPA